ncbi:hypothetical protein ACFXKD_00725 [Nocardiopsis aegyptia]|uniref:hypothetical protein n=1 Tax=Nocardiopsis aegyptia TaxID=220378 RepID=UPI00366CFF3D
MATWIKYALVIAVVAVIGFLLTPIVFTVPETGPQPTSGQVANFMVLGAWDALLLGVAVAVAAFGWPSVRRAFPASKAMAVAVFVSLLFLFGSWWPHLGLHSVVGDNLNLLIAVDYGFHVPLGIASLIILRGLFTIGRERSVEAVGRADAARAPRARAPERSRERDHRHEV